MVICKKITKFRFQEILKNFELIVFIMFIPLTYIRKIQKRYKNFFRISFGFILMSNMILKARNSCVDGTRGRYF